MRSLRTLKSQYATAWVNPAEDAIDQNSRRLEPQRGDTVLAGLGDLEAYSMP